MDIVNLVAELREYREQIDEAIIAMEQLARRRHPGARTAANPDAAAVDKISTMKSQTAAPNRKKKPRASKKKSH
jgi:hypothetical protein